MSKVPAIECELRQLSASEMRHIRDWLDGLLRGQPESGPATADSRVMALRDQVMAGAEQAQAGKVAPFDDAAVGRIRAQGQRLLAGR